MVVLGQFLKQEFPWEQRRILMQSLKAAREKAQTKQLMQPVLQGARFLSYVEIRVNTW